jgi:hypothetical protein
MARTVLLYVASGVAVCGACLALWACAGGTTPSCEVPVGLNPQQLPPGSCPLNPQQLPPVSSSGSDNNSGSSSGGPNAGADSGSADASAVDARPDAFDASSGDALEDSTLDGEGDASLGEDGD